MRIKPLFLLLCQLQIAYADDLNFYVPLVLNQTPAVVNTAPIIVIYNHATSDFDNSFASEQGVMALHQYAKTHSVPQFLSVGERVTNPSNINYEGKKEYLRRSQVDHIIESNVGAHMVAFEGAEHILYAGGYFSECLCQSIRDTIKANSFNKKELKISLIADAIYENTYRVFDFRFRNNLSFINYGPYTVSFSKIISGLNPSQIADYFYQEILGNLNTFCPNVAKDDFVPLELAPYTWTLSINGSDAFQWGDGEKVVHFEIVMTDQLD